MVEKPIRRNWRILDQLAHPRLCTAVVKLLVVTELVTGLVISTPQWQSSQW